MLVLNIDMEVGCKVSGKEGIEVGFREPRGILVEIIPCSNDTGGFQEIRTLVNATHEGSIGRE